MSVHYPFGRNRRRRPGRSWWRSISPIMIVLPLATFTAVFAWGLPQVGGVPLPDQESAHFGLCDSGARMNCVIDGDTFWYEGEKIRIADINTPEVSSPQCAEEAALGAKATRRLHELLNNGSFSLETIDRDRDQYDRLLRVVTRGGESLGDVLVREGLAEEWQGFRGGWC